MKSGFVSIIGLPNVGKSTIINLLNEKKVSIVTPKAQTTRNNITSVINGEDYQIVLLDTPGLQKQIRTQLTKSMNNSIREAVKSADILVLVIDSSNLNEESIKDYLTMKIDIVVLNKIDLVRYEQAMKNIEFIKSHFKNASIVEMQANKAFNKDELINQIVSKLKDGPIYYPDASVVKDDVFYIKEVIREKILFILKKEVPHEIAIYIKDLKLTNNVAKIQAQILVNKESHKGIVIGNKGVMIKKIGTEARKDLEQYFKKKVYLELEVKVKKDWLDSNKELKNLGY